jgi:hypothetical protein
MEDITLYPPQHAPHTTLWIELMNHIPCERATHLPLPLSRDGRTETIPYRLSHRLFSLASSRMFWTPLLPVPISSTRPRPNQSLPALPHPLTPTLLLQSIEDLSRQLAEINAGWNRRPDNRTPSRDTTATAPLLVPPPLWSPGAKVYSALLHSPARENRAADNYDSTGLHYDKALLHQIQVQSAAVPVRHRHRPLRFPPQAHTPVQVASKARPSRGYRHYRPHVSLIMGLRRVFTWRFAVADVTHPLIGADFLSYFGLFLTVESTGY